MDRVANSLAQLSLSETMLCECRLLPGRVNAGDMTEPDGIKDWRL